MKITIASRVQNQPLTKTQIMILILSFFFLFCQGCGSSFELKSLSSTSNNSNLVDNLQSTPPPPSSQLQPNSKCTKYVSKTGFVGDKTAFLSIQEGIKSLVAGDTLCIASGIYNETVSVDQSGTAQNPITIRALDPTKKPILDGEYKLPQGNAANMNQAFYSSTKCYEVSEDPNANLGPSPKQACFTWAYMVVITGSYLFWDGIDIKRSRGHGLLMGRYGPPKSAVQFVTFQNSEISQIRNEGVYIAGITNAYFNNNIVRDTNDFASYSRGAPNIVWTNGTPTFNGGGPGWSGGVYLRYSENVEIKGNKIFHNWGEGIGTGLFGEVTLNTQIRNNQIFDNMSSQLYVSNSSFVTVDKNIIYHTGDPKVYLNGPGWSTCISIASEDGMGFHDVIASNNILSGCAAIFSFLQFRPNSNVAKVKIINNTLLNGAWAIHAPSSSSQPLVLSDLVFTNNLIGPTSQTPLVPTTLQGLSFHHNLWPTEPPSHLNGEGDIITKNSGISVPTYKPSFGNFDVNAIKLTPTSPAINKGTLLSEIITDFFGIQRPKGGAFDIGAHEYSP